MSSTTNNSKNLEKIQSVYSIFQEYYGDDYVDLQGISESLSNVCIIIHFPEVTVTNEYDESINIQDLWANVKLQPDGRIHSGFTLLRSTFPIEQLRADYAHSHIEGILLEDPDIWRVPCLGTGPIRNTISTLMADNNPDIWRLFCTELDLYTKTESVSGTPWRRLSSVGNRGNTNYSEFSTSTIGTRSLSRASCINLPMYRDFINYFIGKKLLKYSYIEGVYDIAISDFDFFILLSNEFIKWVNLPDNPYSKDSEFASFITNSLINTIYRAGKLYTPYGRGNRHSDDEYLLYIQGKKILTFKGKDVLGKVIITPENTTEENDNTVRVLSPNIVYAVRTYIYFIINILYGTKTTKADFEEGRVAIKVI